MFIPTPGGAPFVTDAGLETDFLFQRGLELPEFAAFPLLENDKGLEAFDSYYRDFAAIAKASDASLVLATPTWRANPDWGAAVGYDAPALDRMNRLAVEFLLGIRSSLDSKNSVVISGQIGPRGDGYVACDAPELPEAKAYHQSQVASFADAGADLVEALTMTTMNEAGGIVLAANEVGIPVAILYFTVETDGRLPDGSTLQSAIERVDQIGDVAYFGINCAYPDHIIPALTGGRWMERIAEIRPNASSKSHAELDEATELDAGDIDDLCQGVDELRAMLPNVAVIGGCCGTDKRHVERMWNVPVQYS